MTKSKYPNINKFLRIILFILFFSMVAFLENCTTYANRSEKLYSSLNMSDRKVIYTMDYTIITRYPDSIHSKIIDIANKYKGYMVEQSNELTTIRVPIEHQTEVASLIESLGKLDQKKVYGKDITEEYNDLKIKLETLEKARSRYIELLDKAEGVKAALEVEKELERVNREIDLIKGKITSATHRIEYITITVRTKKEIRPGPVGWIFYGLWKGIGWLFVTR